MLIQNLKKETLGHTKMLIYGGSGVGKTKTLGTLLGKTLIISGESGTKPLEGLDIDVIDISLHDTERMENGKPVVMMNPDDRLAKLSRAFKMLHDGTDYMNVGLDSVSEISEVVLESAGRQFPEAKDSFPMWGSYSKKMKSIVKGFRDLPYNVILTVLSKDEKDDVGKRFKGFDVAGQISGKMPSYFDYVLYLHADAEGKRTFITRKTDTLECKDRSGRLEGREEADLGLIMTKIMLKPAKKEGSK